MNRSHVFGLALVSAIVVLLAAGYLMIAATPRAADVGGVASGSEWPVPVNVNTVRMLVGGDDTLYLIDSNVTAVRTDGTVEWRLVVPQGWNPLKNYDLRVTTSLRPYMSYYSGLEPVADERDGYVYLYMYHPVPVANGTDDSQFIAGVPSKVVAIAPGGRIAWEYPFVCNGTRYSGGLLGPTYLPTDKITVRASGDRVYVFHDHREDVLDGNGRLLFSIGNVAEPAAVDEAGNVYVVDAFRPDLQLPGSIAHPDWLAIRPLDADPQYYREDLQRLAYDPTYMVRTSTIEAYGPAGDRLWIADVGEKIAGTYDDLSPREAVFRSMPIYANGSLYVPVANGTAALDTAGWIRWVRHMEGTGPFEPFTVLPVDDAGNAYECTADVVPGNGMYQAAADPSVGVTRVYRISPAGDVSYAWSYPTYSSPGPVARPDGVVHLFADSNPAIRPADDFEQAVRDFTPDTLVACDIRANRTLWEFTVPREDIGMMVLNESNTRNDTDVAWMVANNYPGMNAVPGMFAGWPADSIPLTPHSSREIVVTEGKTYVYISYNNVVYEDPVVYNRSRCAYVNNIYALDSNGSMAWKMPVHGLVYKLAAGNSTVYYDLLDRGIGGGTVGTMAVGIALSAIALVFIKFFAFGTVARARTRLDSNENRNRVLRYIIDHPGVTAVDIVREAGMNMGTIRYHLLILALNHKIVTHRDNSKFLRYFKNSGAYSDTEKDLLSLMRRKPMLKILNVLLEKQRLSGPDIAKELNISTTAVNRHVAELYEKGIVEKHPAIEKGYEYTIKAERYQSVKDFLSRV